MVDVEGVLIAAERSGAIIRHRALLEQGEFDERRLWLRPEVEGLIRSDRLDAKQREVVRAALRRFIVGGNFTVVTAECEHREVVTIGDLRELKGGPPPFIELRFRPPPHDLRLFGRFIGRDSLILTTPGMKSLSGDNTGRKRLDVQLERKRCDDAFKSMNLNPEWTPPTIQQSVTKASFL
jgi:hypothetical protein